MITICGPISIAQLERFNPTGYCSKLRAMRHLFATLVFLVLLTEPGAAQSRDQNWAWCEGGDPDLSIAGCTALIQSKVESRSNLAIAHNNIGKVLTKLGNYDAAEPHLQTALSLRQQALGDFAIEDPVTLDTFYDLACLAALRGQRAQALELLRKVTNPRVAQLPYAGARPSEDPDLESLRGDPEFEAILVEIERRIGKPMSEESTSPSTSRGFGPSTLR